MTKSEKNVSNGAEENNGHVKEFADNETIIDLEKISLKNKIDEKGTISGKIGTGENAKNSFLYIVLFWSFIIGCGLTVVITGFQLINKFCGETKIDILGFLNCIKDLWAIFTPLITLALGYAFGKSRN